MVAVLWSLKLFAAASVWLIRRREASTRGSIAGRFAVAHPRFPIMAKRKKESGRNHLRMVVSFDRTV
jgi:hypothetical protein